MESGNTYIYVGIDAAITHLEKCYRCEAELLAVNRVFPSYRYVYCDEHPTIVTVYAVCHQCGSTGKCEELPKMCSCAIKH